MILVKIGGDSLKLFPAIAIGMMKEGLVTLAQPVPTGDGELTDIVPLESCLQYNAELLDMVNTLAERAAMATMSIEQLLQVHGVPADITEDSDGTRKVQKH